MTERMVDIFLHSNIECNKRFLVTCAVLNQITCNLPQVPIDPTRFIIPEEVKLADPSYFKPGEVDILIGADIYDLLSDGLFKLGKNMPYLQNTWLGWIIAGTIPKTYSSHCCNMVSLVSLGETSNSQLNHALTEFWEMEEIPCTVNLTAEENLAEEIFVNSVKIIKNSYQVNLPLRSESEYSKLGDSFAMARKRFFNLEKRLFKNPQLFRDYKAFIDEYLALGHCKIVPLERLTRNGDNKYFLPHHCVIRENSSTTKLRVVFDGSAPSSSGISLNDVTLKGFQVQPDLFDILSRFRLFKYVITADIQKMYRQIKVNPEQVFLQNILWRDTPNEPLKCLELSTVTYGTNCAPYLATRVLKDVAQNGAQNYPLASDALLNQCYVDDILTGADTYDDLQSTYVQLNNILNSSGFELHKWCSNNSVLMKNICASAQSPELIIEKKNNINNKVLGLSWDPKRDLFAITLPQNTNKNQFTKRELLSVLAQMFDPLGLIGPIIVVGKIIMQNVWLSKISWDDVLQGELLKQWTRFIADIPHLQDLHISRCLFLPKQVVNIEFHGFADASMKAYAACIYMHAVYSDHTTSCNLVTSKSRVAPVKTVSLPRLELCAMHLLSKLTRKIYTIFQSKITFSSVNLWSDSQIALYWIKSHPSRWSVFVANRVSDIQNIPKEFEWRHVKSSDNPADLLSRGVSTAELINSQLWWHGLRFLQGHDKHYSTPYIELENPPEERKLTHLITSTNNEDFWQPLFKKFSTFSRLQRTVAYCQRFVHNVNNKVSKIVGPLQVCELQSALDMIIKNLQNIHFAKEINELKGNKPLTNKTILSLNPFLDEPGFLCVGGRLENANVSFRQKHPILLPSNNYVVSLLLKLEHTRLGHAGPQNMLSNIRLKFWPLNGLREAKRIVRSCVTCYRFRAQSSKQIMASLPKDRVLISRPFDKVGVDFAGPFQIRSSRLRKAPSTKGYIALFVCMVTKAVHIELVSSLSTDAFLMTFKRFISRRGNPSIVYSDNATNFLGSKNQLKELHDFLKNKKTSHAINDFFSSKETKWNFIPPRSPHWGGMWESAIKSAKYHFYRLVGNANFTFEEMTTILTQIEAILNSRPLCPLSSDPLDFQCLTPGHFLIGTSLTAYPERDISQIPDNRLSLFQQITNIQQTFWKRWSVDYLNRLQNRPKWFTPTRNLQVNDVVLIKEDNVPPLKWPLARIVDVMPGADGRVRVVKVRTRDGLYARSITKLCPLPYLDKTLNP